MMCTYKVRKSSTANPDVRLSSSFLYVTYMAAGRVAVKCVTSSMSALGVNSLLSRLLNLYVFYICRVPQTAGKVQVVHNIMFVFKQHHYGCFSLGLTLKFTFVCRSCDESAGRNHVTPSASNSF